MTNTENLSQTAFEFHGGDFTFRLPVSAFEWFWFMEALLPFVGERFELEIELEVRVEEEFDMLLVRVFDDPVHPAVRVAGVLQGVLDRINSGG